MKTYLDCIPCIFRHGLHVSRMADCTAEQQKEIMDSIAELIPNFSLNNTPPEMAGLIQELIRKKTDNADPYTEIKKISSAKVKEILPKIKEIISRSENPLLMSVKLAIAANIIDYGANADLDLTKELLSLLKKCEEHISTESSKLFNYAEFEKKLSKSGTLLYIGDNVGEHFFDRLLIEQIKDNYPQIKITYAYRDEPILNDVTRENIIEAEIEELADIISSGSKLPGTVLRLCSRQFTEIFGSSDMIISKGQGNYETLSDESGPIFFLLMAKCPIIAEHANCRLKDILLIKNY